MSESFDSQLVAAAPGGAARAKLEFLLEELQADVMLCSTRDQHIRLIQRIESLKDALSVL